MSEAPRSNAAPLQAVSLFGLISMLVSTMDDESRQALANDRAEKYAPAPTGGSLLAGVCGAVVALLGDVGVSAFYGWRLQDHLLLSAGVTVIGFLFVFVGYKRLARLSRAARKSERVQVDVEQDR